MVWRLSQIAEMADWGFLMAILAAFCYHRPSNQGKEINTIDHIQVGWITGNLGDFDRRERRLLMVAAGFPDIDGIVGVAAAIITRNWDWHDKIHHTFGHNVFWMILAGILCAAVAKRRRILMFFLGILMVFLHFFLDLAANDLSWDIPFFWPLNKFAYDVQYFFYIPPAEIEKWSFILRVVVQNTLKLAFLSVTVVIYIKHGRTFIELISSNLDRFLTDFAILPFRKKCDVPDCGNRAHYRCADNDSARCIKHCKINRDLTISCT